MLRDFHWETVVFIYKTHICVLKSWKQTPNLANRDFQTELKHLPISLQDELTDREKETFFFPKT